MPLRLTNVSEDALLSVALSLTDEEARMLCDLVRMGLEATGLHPNMISGPETMLYRYLAHVLYDAVDLAQEDRIREQHTRAAQAEDERRNHVIWNSDRQEDQAS